MQHHVFSLDEVGPGEQVDINIQTEGEARVGIAAVDRSVFILAENRLNLEQVFAELERLYMQPQAELHEVSIYPITANRGAEDIFKNVGVVVARLVATAIRTCECLSLANLSSNSTGDLRLRARYCLTRQSLSFDKLQSVSTEVFGCPA